MSYTRTPDLPREHPQIKALERSMKAHKPITCEQCRYWIPSHPDDTLKQCLGVEVVLSPINATLYAPASHGCWTWEPRT